jgi:hypothetical protein
MPETRRLVFDPGIPGLRNRFSLHLLKENLNFSLARARSVVHCGALQDADFIYSMARGFTSALTTISRVLPTRALTMETAYYRALAMAPDFCVVAFVASAALSPSVSA